jgi:hypothetical protein
MRQFLLQNGELDMQTYINEICDRIDVSESLISALLPETNRRTRLLNEASILEARFPDPARRPPLYGIPGCERFISCGWFSHSCRITASREVVSLNGSKCSYGPSGGGFLGTR